MRRARGSGDVWPHLIANVLPHALRVTVLLLLGVGAMVGDDEAEGDSADVGEAPAEVGGVGLSVTHPARSTTAAATMVHRRVSRFSTKLS